MRRLILAAGCAAGLAGPVAGQERFDLLIRGGRVMDGTGNPWIRADVGISGDRIRAVGDLSRATAAKVIDAKGRLVTPGFIDVHSHAGPGLETAGLSAGVPLLAQGITTVVVNPDGGGPTDLAAQRGRLTAARIGLNVALMVPHGSIRREVIGMADRPPTAAELERMRGIVRAGMAAGAFGLSSGPYYAPGSFARTDELIALARIAGEGGGLYTSHIRDESDYSVGVLAAVEEVVTIADSAGIPGVVTHIKALGPNVWGFSAPIVRRIEEARGRGTEIFADQYPYEASSTGLSAALVPRWAEAGGDTAMRRRFDDPTDGPRIRREMVDNLARRGGAARLMIGRNPRDPALEGRTLQQIAESKGVSAVEAAIAILKVGGAGVISFNMDEADIERLMRQPWTMTSSDGGLVPMGEGVPHPRAYGTFPRKLVRYVQQRGTVTLEEAIRSMTSLPATVFRMSDRGVIRPGAIADLLVFDPARLEDPSDYQKPHRLAKGMSYVVVAGKLAVEDGTVTPERNGRVLSRSGGN